MPETEFRPDLPSSDYAAMQPYWDTVTDLLDGAEAVRRAGQKYLPKLPAEEATAYNYRRKTAKFTNIFADVVANLAAKPVRREVRIRDGSARSRTLSWAEDIDTAGTNLHRFAAEVLLNGIAFGLDWIFVSYNSVQKPDGVPILTLAEVDAQGGRPYCYRIPAGSVIAVRTARIKGRDEFVHVRIHGFRTETEGFSEKQVECVTLFERSQAVDGSYGAPYWVRYNKVKTSSGREEWVTADGGTLSIGVIPLVPFLTGRRKGSSWQVVPPMQGVADLQIEHYQQESALKHIKEMAAFPMLSASGVRSDARVPGGPPPTIRVGPQTVLYAPPGPDGRIGEWKFVEPQGNSLRFLADDIKATEQQLRELGRQPLTAHTGNLTVVTTAFAASKANSAVAAWALNLKDTLERMFELMVLWEKGSDAPEVEIDTDFAAEFQDDASADALIKMRAAGDLSVETLWSEMKRRGVLAPEFNPQDETERLALEQQGLEADGYDAPADSLKSAA